MDFAVGVFVPDDSPDEYFDDLRNTVAKTGRRIFLYSDIRPDVLERALAALSGADVVTASGSEFFDSVGVLWVYPTDVVECCEVFVDLAERSGLPMVWVCVF